MAVSAVSVVAAIVGVLVLVTAMTRPGPPPQPGPPVAQASVAPSPTTTSPPAPTPNPVPPTVLAPDFGPTMPASAPVGLQIPSIGVDERALVPLGKQADGTLEVPRDYARAGWYTPGPTPGQFGPAVIAGHVDSYRGPAVFYQLGELEPGDAVSVPRADGSTATFTVYKVGRYPKDAFPTGEVYFATTDRAELRLITCGGAFDSSVRSYDDNIVVFASLQ